MSQKVDHQKIQSLKAKWLDKLFEIDNHNIAIQQLQQDIQEIKKQLDEEQAKDKK